MVFKTLHWYIFRELLRIFVLTASALTTLLAFGGTFKEITRRGVDVGQLMAIVTNLMPAMLAYTIPIAALFAAVLVYWRLSTDNELTACRASGISFVTIVMPALFLGVVVASTSRSISSPVRPALLSAASAAWVARSEVSSPSAAIWRWRMPVRCAIHSSDVRRRPASSALVTILCGR